MLELLRRWFAANSDGLVAAYVFGSVARGTQRPGSDVDIGVLLADRPDSLAALDRVAELQDRLADLLRREVDLVVLNGASPDFLHRVLMDRELLVDVDPERRIEFEIRARNDWFDLAPLLERYRRDVLRRA